MAQTASMSHHVSTLLFLSRAENSNFYHTGARKMSFSPPEGQIVTDYFTVQVIKYSELNGGKFHLLNQNALLNNFMFKKNLAMLFKK